MQGRSHSTLAVAGCHVLASPFQPSRGASLWAAVAYAVDINPAMIIHLNQRIRQAGLDNVRTMLALPDDPLLPDASVDRFFICETWHHIENRARI